jgi:hypothetical protein
MLMATFPSHPSTAAGDREHEEDGVVALVRSGNPLQDLGAAYGDAKGHPARLLELGRHGFAAAGREGTALSCDV